MPIGPLIPPDPPRVKEATSAMEAMQIRSAMLIRMCAAWHNADGSIGELGLAMGCGSRTVYHYVTGGRLLPPHLAIRLEDLVGRRVVRREDLRPDHFLPLSDEKTPGA